MSETRVTLFGKSNHRHYRWHFGLKRRDRFSHMHVCGKTGVGKTTLLETMVLQDIAHGEGCALIDPHGDLGARIVAQVPEHRRDDLMYLDVPNPKQPFGYNPITRVQPQQRALVASGLMDVFRQMWSDAWGVRMEYILRNTVLTLLDQPHATLPDIIRLHTDEQYRKQALERVAHGPVRRFWEVEYDKYSEGYRIQGLAPIQNKVGAFLADPRLYRIFTREDGLIRLRSVMDEGKILIVNLSKGEIGTDSASLLGGLLVTSLSLAAFSRANVSEADRRAFFLYADEFQNFTTLAIANMASELRKFGVGLILANQYLDQLKPDIKNAVTGNAGTLVSFRLNARDASSVARELSPTFEPMDLMKLPNYEMYLKLMIDGMPCRPFSAFSLRPDEVSKLRFYQFINSSRWRQLAVPGVYNDGRA